MSTQPLICPVCRDIVRRDRELMKQQPEFWELRKQGSGAMPQLLQWIAEHYPESIRNPFACENSSHGSKIPVYSERG